MQAITAINLTSWLLEWLEANALHSNHFVCQGVDSWGMAGTPRYTLGQFCDVFVDLFAQFDAYWTEAAPGSVMEFATIAEAFRASTAQWAKKGPNQSASTGA